MKSKKLKQSDLRLKLNNITDMMEICESMIEKIDSKEALKSLEKDGVMTGKKQMVKKFKFEMVPRKYKVALLEDLLTVLERIKENNKGENIVQAWYTVLMGMKGVEQIPFKSDELSFNSYVLKFLLGENGVTGEQIRKILNGEDLDQMIPVVRAVLVKLRRI